MFAFQLVDDPGELVRQFRRHCLVATTIFGFLRDLFMYVWMRSFLEQVIHCRPRDLLGARVVTGSAVPEFLAPLDDRVAYLVRDSRLSQDRIRINRVRRGFANFAKCLRNFK